MRSALFERVLREIEVTSESLLDWLRMYFKAKLNIDRSLLPNNFIKTMATAIVKSLLRSDRLFHNDEGFILIPTEGTKLRRGATYFQIRAFIDIVVQTCSNFANEMLKIPIEKLEPYHKTFIQTFSDESSNKTWKLELANHLTDKIAKSKPFYIKAGLP